MKKLQLLLILLILPCYAARRVAKNPTKPNPKQTAAAKTLIRSMLPKVPESDIKQLDENILVESWDKTSGQFDERKIKKLVRDLFNLHVAGEPIPLPNPNNVCFMNGAIQAIFNIRPFINFVVAHADLYTQELIAPSFIEVFKQMQKGEVVEDVLLNAYSTINPPRIGANGKPIYQQGDPDEFIRSLLNGFRVGLDAYTATGGRPDNFLPDSLFKFQTQAVHSRYPEQQYELLLAIPEELRNPEKMFTLKTLMDHYFDKDILITEPPQQLVVLIKRTEVVPTFIEVEVESKKPETKVAATPTNKKPAPKVPTIKQERLIMKSTRIDSKISIPLRLSIKDYFGPTVKNSDYYRLTAAICHLGTGEGGHYVSYIQTPNGDWFYTNDMEIEPKTFAEMKDFEKKGFVRENALPYVLIYEAEALAPAKLYQENLEEKKEAAAQYEERT